MEVRTVTIPVRKGGTVLRMRIGRNSTAHAYRAELYCACAWGGIVLRTRIGWNSITHAHGTE
jgi:hypothetical protein